LFLARVSRSSWNAPPNRGCHQRFMYALVDRTVPIEVARVQSLSKDLVDETAVTFAAA
jgi:hypothetical protein